MPSPAMKLSSFVLVACLPLVAIGDATYAGGIDFKQKGWDAAFGDPDIVHNNMYQAGNTLYRVNVAAADVPRPRYGGNVSSALALSLQRPQIASHIKGTQLHPPSSAATSHRGHGYPDADFSVASPRGGQQQKPLGPDGAPHDGREAQALNESELIDLCVSIYHLSDEAQKRARYDHGDCRSFLSDECIDIMTMKTEQLCGGLRGSREPPVRSSSLCVGDDTMITFGGVEHTLEWDAFWAYRADNPHDPADESPLRAMQEAVVPIVWHTTKGFGEGGGKFTVINVNCVRAESIPPRPRPTPTTITKQPAVTATSTDASIPERTGNAGRVMGAAGLVAVLAVM